MTRQELELRCEAEGGPWERAFLQAVKRAETHYGENAPRLQRAIDLVIDGAVHLHADGKSALVDGSEGRIYAVSQHGACLCADYYKRDERKWACKHAIAVALIRRTNQQIVRSPYIRKVAQPSQIAPSPHGFDSQMESCLPAGGAPGQYIESGGFILNLKEDER